MTFLYYFLLVLFLLLSFVIWAVVLVQESKTTGLGASFGGEASDSLFGTSTPEVLKKITAYLGVIFLVGCVVLSLWTGALARAKSGSGAFTEEVLER